MTEPVLVVDFGTTTSSAVLVTGGGSQVVREPGSDRDWWPSAVCVDGDEVLVGSPAEQLKRYDPAAHRAEFKLDLGDREPIPLGGKSFRPQDLVVELLSAISAEAEQLHGAPIPRAVLTVPASYSLGDPRRDLMIEAGERVGFAEVELLPEPVAAAFAPVRGEPFATGDVVLVYDFGGGTFDAALIEIAADGRHRVLGHDAEAACGGRDMDAALHSRLRGMGGDRLAELLADDSGMAGHVASELSELVRRVKHHLSDAATVRDFLHAAGLRVTMDRAELTELCRPVVEQTISCCRRLLAAHESRSPTAVLLVGGTCRMPLIAEAVAGELCLTVRFAREVSTAVVQGAAEWARHGVERVAAPAEPAPDERALRWAFPDGSATLVRWLVEPGESYAAHTPLATVRLADGTLHRLTADDTPGALVRTHADPGASIMALDWLVTAGPPAAASAPAGPAAVGRSAVGPVTAPKPRSITQAGARYVAFAAEGRLVVIAGTDSVSVRNTNSGGEVHRLELGPDSGGLNHVAVSSDGRYVVVARRKQICVWDWISGKEIGRYELPASAAGVAVDATGHRVAVGVGGRSLRLYLAVDGVLSLGPVIRHVQAASTPLRLRPLGFAISPDGSRTVTTGGDAIHVWSSADGERLLTLSTGGSFESVIAQTLFSSGLQPSLARAVPAAFSPDGRRLTAAGSFGILIWEVVTGQLLTKIINKVPLGITGSFNGIAFSPAGDAVAAVSTHGTHTWDSATGALLHWVESAGVAVAFSPDRRWLAIADPDKNAVSFTPLRAD